MYHNTTVRKLQGCNSLLTAAIFLVFLSLSDTSFSAGDFAPSAARTGGDGFTRQTQAMDEQIRLRRGVFLIAKKSMPDPNFAQTVVLITEYGDTGTIGLTLNRPLDKPAQDVVPELKQLVAEPFNLYQGGPVRLNSLRLLAQTETALNDYHAVVGNVFQIVDLKGVQNLIQRELGQFRLRLYAGYAGWSPGQLERELLRGDWRLSRADPDLIFTDDPASLWEKLMDRIDMQWVRREKTDASYLYQNKL